MLSKNCDLIPQDPQNPIERPKLTKRPEPEPAPDWALGLPPSPPGFVRAALTGNMGSGKSTVAELLVAFGAELIDFDELARFVLSPRSEGWTKVVELFGPKIVLKDDNLDRPKIASLVFKNPSALKALEDIIHPLAWRLMLDRLNELKDSPMVVIDIPLLFEAGVNSLFRPVIVCHADYNTRYQRLRARDPKRSRRLTKKMLASQWPVTEKIRLADAIINNTGSFVQLIRQTKALWLKLTSQPDKPA